MQHAGVCLATQAMRLRARADFAVVPDGVEAHHRLGMPDGPRRPRLLAHPVHNPHDCRLLCVAEPYISADSVAAVVIGNLDEKRLDSPRKLPLLPGQSIARVGLQRITKMSALSEEEASLLIAQQVTNVYSAFWLGWQWQCLC